MESNATSGHLHHEKVPLATCGARARLALESGLITRAAYQSLIGITAEALVATPPPVARTEEEERSSSPPPQDDETPSSKLQMMKNCPIIQNQEGAGPKLLTRDQSRGECATGLDSAPTPPTSAEESERSLLDKMQEEGLDLSSGAMRIGDDYSSMGSAKKNDDRRLLRFVDICLQTFAPRPIGSPSELSPDASERLRDVARRNRSEPVMTKKKKKPIVEGGTSTRIQTENARWEVRLADLLRFKASRGHCNVPFRYEPDKSLGGWVQKQRNLHKKGKLPRARFERLDFVGFSWVLSNKKIPKINDDSVHSYEGLWNLRYDGLVEYERLHSHCNVPYRYSKDAQLGRWVQNQREFYKRDLLSSDRYRRLVAVGFRWSLRKGGKWGDAKRKEARNIYGAQSAEC